MPMKYAKDDLEEIHYGSDAYGLDTKGFSSNPTYTIDGLYDKDSAFPPGWRKEQLAAKMNTGVHIVNHFGHSSTLYNMKLCNAPISQSGMYCGDSGDTDINNLNNQNYFLVYTQGCYPGSLDNLYYDNIFDGIPITNEDQLYTRSDSIGESFITSEHGAFAFIGNSRFGWFNIYDTAGPSHLYNREFWDAAFGEGIFNLGNMHSDAKEDVLANWLDFDIWMRWVYYNLNLFGDPELQLHVYPPNIDVEITSPEKGKYLKGQSIPITGTASGEDFKSYQLLYSSNNQEIPITEIISSGVSDAQLGVWDISSLEDDQYELILRLTTKDDLAWSYNIRVSIDNANQPPEILTGNQVGKLGETLWFNLEAQDPDDPDTPAGTLSYEAANLPEGSSFNPGTGLFTWTPIDESLRGSHNVRFTVRDNQHTVNKIINIFIIQLDEVQATDNKNSLVRRRPLRPF